MEQKIKFKNGDSIVLNISDRWYETEEDRKETQRNFKQFSKIAPKDSFSEFYTFISERMK